MLDPIGWILGSLVNALVASLELLMLLIQIAVLQRPPIDGFAFYDELGGLAVAGARPVAFLVLFITAATAVFWRTARGRLAPAVMYAVAVTVVTPYWYRFISSLQDFSIMLTTAVLSMFGHTGTLADVQQRVNDGVAKILEFDFQPMAGFDAILGSLMLGSALVSGALLVGLCWMYIVLTQVLAFVGLFALALLSLGERAQRFFNAIVAVALVAIIFGLPMIVLTLEVGLSFVDSSIWEPLGDNSAFATGIVANLTFGLALLSQVGLLIVFTKSTKRVIGKVKSVINGGQVNTTPSGRNLDANMTQNNSVSRAMSEPEKALSREHPALVPQQGEATALQATQEGQLSATATLEKGTLTATDVTAPPTGGPPGAGTPVSVAGPGNVPPPPPVPQGAGAGAQAATAGRGVAATAGRGAATVAAPAAPSGVAVSTAGAGIAGAGGAGVAAVPAAAAGAGGAGAGVAAAAGTPAVAATAAAAGAPTAGVGTAVVVGGAVAAGTVKHVKENHEAKKAQEGGDKPEGSSIPNP